jgi:lipopolysaccharide biosynthesis protein
MAELEIAAQHDAERVAEAKASLAKTLALEHLVAERDAQVAALEHLVAERDAQGAVLEHLVAERDAQVAVLEHLVAERDAQVAVLEHLVAERDAQVAVLEHLAVKNHARLAAYAERINEVERSLAWRATARIKGFGSAMRAAPLGIRIAAAWRYPTRSGRRKAYRQAKLAPVAATTSTLPDTGGLADVPQANSDGALFRRHVLNVTGGARSGEFVQETSAPVDAEPGAPKLVAYYLPQFHPIPENDEWWGKGFTEWRNVARAYPVFEDHYQPRMPGELGYYDLRNTDIIRRQAELAREYGLSAFCFHFYWFGGKRLLEMPIDTFLTTQDIDLEFSLCWANENWSRRWDGGTNELLISQEHSPEDDIAFIRYVDRYFKDRRYMRVEGKPVLTIYRPTIIPDVKATLLRWREEAHRMGYPGLYLIATNSFGFDDHVKLGFDALSEFPPHAIRTPDIQPHLRLASTRAGGHVYSYPSVVENELERATTSLTVHPGVMPGWDNSARRPHNGHIFHGATPALFARWLRHAIGRTVERPAAERFVFINAWNEWAEGAYLEPDIRYGYAWLHALRAARNTDDGNVAIVLHAFYPDVFAEILSVVGNLPERHKLFVTTVAEHEDTVRRMLDESGRLYSLFIVENRGRDVRPFLSVIPTIRAENFDIILKVHTKKSLHRSDGGQWLHDMINKLLDPEVFARGLEAFAADPTLGMIGPDGHYLPMLTYIGENEARVLSIGERLGFSESEIFAQPFVSGTMFMVRTAALEPLLDLGVADFELEVGQKDGTLAHALERVMTLSVKAAGMRIALSGNPETPPRMTDRYAFAVPSR